MVELRLRCHVIVSLLLLLLLLLPPLSDRSLAGQQESSFGGLVSRWLDQQDLPGQGASLQRHGVSWRRQVWQAAQLNAEVEC
jgi:hypothetical protein